MSIVEEVKAKRKEQERETDERSLRPRTLLEPDRDTFYCDVRNRRFKILGVKILQSYANGDCRVLTPNGVQFTARATEVFHIRKGDYHEAPDLSDA